MTLNRERAALAAREIKFAHCDLKAVDGAGVFCGYASLFGREDLAHDVIAPGAFARSIARRGTSGIKLLFQHDPAQPIGVWLSLKEDALGLFVEGRLMSDVAKAREVESLMRAGALDGLSIGFRAVKASRDRRSGVRRIEEIDLWEISIVTFPMQPEARISASRAASAPDRLPTEREFERWLTRDAGLTRTEARTVIARGFRSLNAARDAGASSPDGRLLARLQDAARRMSPGLDPIA